MSRATDLRDAQKKKETWNKYCGFLDLSLAEFMRIQKTQLMQQVRYLADSKIGKMLFGSNPPQTVDEFRRNIPLTNYEIYAPYLLERREDVLPPGEYMWAYTSGRTSLSGHKWVPLSRRTYDFLGDAVTGAMLLASCKKRGDVSLESNDKILFTTAPKPFISGFLSFSAAEKTGIQFLPSLEEGEKMTFDERINTGFSMATELGLDYFFGLSSVLAKVGEIYERGRKSRLSRKYLKPAVLYRMLRGMLRAKLAGRNVLPRDIWDVKGIITTGTDTRVYCEKVERYWGRQPLEGYICTEGGALATMAWTYYGLNFYPDSNFLEFIPYEEYLKNKFDRNYQPRTQLLDEIRPGLYELVFTNLLGGVFVRYRIGDLFEVVDMADREAGIYLPQFRLYSRTEDIIDIGAIARITEAQIAQSVEYTGLKYVDWVARKEAKDEEVYLHIYIELRDNISINEEDLSAVLREALIRNVPEFPDLEELLGSGHLKITQLVPGSFAYYKDFQLKVGAELAHLKPLHIQPSDAAMNVLLERSHRK